MTPLPPSQPAAPQKKSSSGCLIAVLVIGGLVAVACIAGAVMVGVAAQSPEGKKAMSLVGKGMGVITKAMNAPGAQQVREAGCADAMVIDAAEISEAFGELFDAGTKKQEDEKVIVMCQGTFGLPTCDEVADAYRNAPGVKPGPFTVIVKKKNAKKNDCEQDY
ncbi:MAG: hypothetical protein ACO1OB_20615 [Archangium sp.]